MDNGISKWFQPFIHHPPPRRIHYIKTMQFHEFDVFVFECSFFVMLFLITDVIIHVINRRMRNTKHTETSLPNKFFLNEIFAVDIMGVTTIISLETLKRLEYNHLTDYLFVYLGKWNL
jgi:hypothetical protein